MTFSVLPFTEERYDEWQRFVAASNEGTLFHRLDFLAYHGDRFKSREHHLMVMNGDSLFAVMPMALLQEEDRVVARSPYGGSLGGPASLNPLDYGESKELTEALLGYLRRLGADKVRITLPITPCYKRYSDTIRFAFLESGFQCVGRDISGSVYLGKSTVAEEIMSSRARNSVRKAEKVGVTAVHRGNLLHFWSLMEKTFERHGRNPTHTFQEFQWLAERLPDEVYVDVAYLGEKPISGVGYFKLNDQAMSTFYLCNDPSYTTYQGQSLLIRNGMKRALLQGFQWFDFGLSSYLMVGRPANFRFKESFGAIGVFRETYELALG